MSNEVMCLVCDQKVNVPENTMKAEILACISCGQEHEVLEVQPNVNLGLAPEVEEDWGE